MKLSDAIMLGITRWKLEPRLWTCVDGGCLLGIGLLATGWKQPEEEEENSFRAIEQTWPWIHQRFKLPVLINGEIYGSAPFEGWPSNVQTSDAVAILSRLAVQVKYAATSLEDVIAWLCPINPYRA